MESFNFTINHISSTVRNILRHLSKNVIIKKLIDLSTEKFDPHKIDISFAKKHKLGNSLCLQLKIPSHSLLATI